MENPHARLMATRLRILQVNDSAIEASAVVNIEGQGMFSALPWGMVGDEAGLIPAAHRRGIALAGTIVLGLV